MLAEHNAIIKAPSNAPIAIPIKNIFISFLTKLNSSLSARYNPETDYLEVLFNGEWIPAQYLGIQWNGVILQNGSFNSAQPISSYSGVDCNVITVSSSSGSIIMDASSAYNDIVPSGIAVPNSPINLTNYKHITIKGTLSKGDNTTATDTIGYCYVGIGATYPANGTIFDSMSKTTLAYMTNATTINFEKTIDISEFNEDVYIAFKTIGNANRYIKSVINSIVCSK